MAQSKMVRRLNHILAAARNDGGVPDAHLLQQFSTDGDAAAFELLVWRYQRLVLGVCRRVLRDVHDAEDAFQATFLVLARKAGSLAKSAPISGWLYQVATRAALAVRAAKLRQAAREHCRGINEVSPAPTPEVLAEGLEMSNIVDEEVSRLPQRFREAVVLYYFEGKTVEETARLLGCPQGTVASRLTRARERLRIRLTRRGLACTASTLAAGLTESGLTSAAAEDLVSRTCRLVLVLAVGRSLPGPGSTTILALSQEVLKAMSISKFTTGVALLVMALMLLGGGLVQQLHSGAVTEPEQAANTSHQTPDGKAVQGPVIHPGRLDNYGNPLPLHALARLQVMPLLHSGNVDCLAYSPNGKILASGGKGNIILWEAKSGRKICRIPADTGWFKKPVFSPNSKLLITASEKGEDSHLQVWDVDNGALAFTLLMEEGVAAVAFSPDGKTIASIGAPRNLLCLWDAQIGKRISVLGRIDDIINFSSLAFSKDGKMLLAAGFNRNKLKTLCFDLETSSVVPRLLKPESEILGLTLSPDGSVIAATGSEGIRLYRASNLVEMHQLQHHNRNTWPLAFSPDSKMLVSTSEGDETTYVWDVESGKQRFRLPFKDSIRTAAMSPDGGILATAGSSYGIVIRTWDAQTGISRPRLASPYGLVDPVMFLRDGETLVSAVVGEAFTVWPRGTGKESCQVKLPRESQRCCLSPDRSTLAVPTMDGTLFLLEISTGRELIRCPIARKQFFVRTISVDNQRVLVYVGDSRTENVVANAEVWDLKTKKILHRFGSKDVPLALSPDGHKVLMQIDDGNSIWDLDNGKEVSRYQGLKGGDPHSFSPDGRTVVMEMSDGSIRLWETATGMDRLQLEWYPKNPGVCSPDSGNPNAMVFSPNGRYLATGHADKMVRLWDAQDGKQIKDFAGHYGSVFSLAFSPDGSRLVSGSIDTTAIIWEIPAACRAHKPIDVHLTREELNKLWLQLADPNAAKAYVALHQLAQSSSQAVPLCQELLSETTPTTSEQIQRWMVQLDDEEFAVREQASLSLERAGRVAQNALEKALNEAPSLEVRHRVNALLKTLKPQRIRLLRAMELLERIGTPGAVAILRQVEKKTNDLDVRDDAQRSIGRLAEEHKTP